jgi:hypothetical protein
MLITPKLTMEPEIPAKFHARRAFKYGPSRLGQWVMSIRIRKFIGGIAVVAFVIAYAVGVVMLSERLPDLWWVKIIFYAAAGISWGLPILPLLRWMNGDGK